MQRRRLSEKKWEQFFQYRIFKINYNGSLLKKCKRLINRDCRYPINCESHLLSLRIIIKISKAKRAVSFIDIKDNAMHIFTPIAKCQLNCNIECFETKMSILASPQSFQLVLTFEGMTQKWHKSVEIWQRDSLVFRKEKCSQYKQRLLQLIDFSFHQQFMNIL